LAVEPNVEAGATGGISAQEIRSAASPRARCMAAADLLASLSRRLELFLIVGLGLVVLSAGISKPPLVDWDEATYAEVVHEAIANHHYVDFTWNARPYLKKPPLLFWSMVGCFKIFGESEFAARLPSVAAGIATLVFIYLIGAYAAGRLAGTLAALIPLQFYFFVARGGRDCATDAPLLCFVTLAMYGLMRAPERRRFSALAGVASGLAILSKGLAGTIPLIIAPLAIFLLPGFEAVGVGGLTLILGGVVAVAAPWYLYEAIHNPLFWTSFVGHETVARVVSHLEDETHSGWYTLHVFAKEVRFLWPLILPAGAMAAVAMPGGGIRLMPRMPNRATSLWILWFVVAIGAACAVQTKLPWYVLPALVPTSLLAGTLAARALEYRGGMRGGVAVAGILGLAIIAAGVPSRSRLISRAYHNQRLRSKPSYVMGLKARRAAVLLGGGQLYYGGAELPTLVYYAGMRCNFVPNPDEITLVTDIDDDQPPSMDPKDLVLVDPQREEIVIDNLVQEWAETGPSSSR
jgi:4-amino-4-deoxy-L-arabinose transferase-like glycosyltransferase